MSLLRRASGGRGDEGPVERAARSGLRARPAPAPLPARAGAALALRLAGDVVREARVAFSGVAPMPRRAKAVEAALTGQHLNAATIGHAAAAAVTGAEPLAHNGYKVPLLRGLVEEAEAIARG